jgi:hypothetical protein
MRYPFWSHGNHQFGLFGSAYGSALEVYDADDAPSTDEAGDAAAGVAPLTRC